MITLARKTMLKSLKLLKKYREIFLDVTIEEPEEFDEIGISFVNQFDEAIAELEALQSKSCEGCKCLEKEHMKFVQ